jgi:hypothetical protein
MAGTLTHDHHIPRVPVEHRFLGLDKRSFPYAAAVLVVWLVWAVIVPKVNDAIAYDDPVVAGDRMALTDDIVFTPAVGWNVTAGFRVGEEGALPQSGAAVLDSGGVQFAIVPDAFDGTPNELIQQINKVTTRTTKGESFHVTGQRFTVTTDSGEVGVAEGFVSPRTQGVIAAFVIDGTGLQVQVVGPPDQISAVSDQVTDMVESITKTGDSA